eukprot:COSAG01_NODE_68457_length_264_cov_0.618182_1_plen_60_part_10
MTLLSNRNSTLPLKPGGRIAVIGANAQTRTLMAGGTGGVRSHSICPLFITLKSKITELVL